jgi:hypothetical protein
MPIWNRPPDASPRRPPQEVTPRSPSVPPSSNLLVLWRPCRRLLAEQLGQPREVHRHAPGILSARQGAGKRRGGSAMSADYPAPMVLSELSGAPRIAQGGKPSQGVTAIDPVMHQEAFDEGAHLISPRERQSCVPSRMIGVSSHLDKLKYRLRRLSSQRELVLDVRPVPEAVGHKLHHSASRARSSPGCPGSSD